MKNNLFIYAYIWFYHHSNMECEKRVFYSIDDLINIWWSNRGKKNLSFIKKQSEKINEIKEEQNDLYKNLNEILKNN